MAQISPRFRLADDNVTEKCLWKDKITLSWTDIQPISVHISISRAQNCYLACAQIKSAEIR